MKLQTASSPKIEVCVFCCQEDPVIFVAIFLIGETDGYSELGLIPAQLSFATLLTTQGRSNTIRMNSYILPATPDLVHQLFSVTFR